jgi:hypothetical protein
VAHVERADRRRAGNRYGRAAAGANVDRQGRRDVGDPPKSRRGCRTAADNEKEVDGAARSGGHASMTNALDTSRIFIVILPKFVPRACQPR